MIVADTSAIIALIDADDRHHTTMLHLFEADPAAWILSWAILPEVDYLLSRYVSAHAAEAFAGDVVEGAFEIEWGEAHDLRRAQVLRAQYADLQLGLVDSVVAAIAERLGAIAIATLDLRDFGSMKLLGQPEIWPRDAT